MIAGNRITSVPREVTLLDRAISLFVIFKRISNHVSRSNVNCFLVRVAVSFEVGLCLLASPVGVAVICANRTKPDFRLDLSSKLRIHANILHTEDRDGRGSREIADPDCPAFASCGWTAHGPCALVYTHVFFHGILSPKRREVRSLDDLKQFQDKSLIEILERQ